MYKELYGDRKTSSYRLEGFTSKAQILRRIYGLVILLLLGLWILVSVENKLVDHSIKAVMLKNAIIYHDINGFKPVH